MTHENKLKISAIAKSLIGKPYKYGAKPEEAPHVFDCSSFVQYLYKEIGIDLPRSSILQAADKQGTEIIPASDFSNLEPGDLLFMRGAKGHYDDSLFTNREVYIGHVVIYLGQGEIIQASSTSNAINTKTLTKILEKSQNKIVLVKRY